MGVTGDPNINCTQQFFQSLVKGNEKNMKGKGDRFS